jgi:hypothetical protein
LAGNSESGVLDHATDGGRRGLDLTPHFPLALADDLDSKLVVLIVSSLCNLDGFLDGIDDTPFPRYPMMTQTYIEQIYFNHRDQARSVRTGQGQAISQTLAALALPRPRMLLILNGGTAELNVSLEATLTPLMTDGLARIVCEEGITTITGGTAAGIFHLFGQGLARWGRTAPCIGVAVRSLVSWPGQPEGKAPLEPNHSHCVLVDGERWGDETDSMYALAAALAAGCPSVAVFAGGGEIAIREMLANVTQQRPMILVSGSGRATDAVLAVRGGQVSDDPRIAAISHQGSIYAHDLCADPAALREAVRQILAAHSPPAHT